MKLTRRHIREAIRRVITESKITPEPPFITPGNPGYQEAWSKWNVWFFENTRDWAWTNMPEQKGWNAENLMYDFRTSDTGGAEIKYGIGFGYRWSKYRNNTLRLLVVPEAGYGQPEGIYLHFEIGLGGMKNIDARSMAEMYFPFKKFKPTKNKGMSAPEIIEELSFYHDEIVECMRILTPLGSKTVKSLPASKFYDIVWPKLEKYASPVMDDHIRLREERISLRNKRMGL